MTENLKNFLKMVSEDKALAEKVSKMDKAELIAAAKELGIELTDMDFPVSHEEIADAQLIGVTGGTGENSFHVTPVPHWMSPMSPDEFELWKNAVDPIFQDEQG